MIFDVTHKVHGSVCVCSCFINYLFNVAHRVCDKLVLCFGFVYCLVLLTKCVVILGFILVL